jgi:predicted component of type VI protein secretion system
MKQLTKVLALIAVAMVLLSACHSSKSCPAYGGSGKVVKPVPAARG